MVLPLSNSILTMISILISVAFYTILERKFLGYIQIRKGPNKVGIMGVLQPFSDAIKLFNKTLISSEVMNFSLVYFTPAMALVLALLILPILPFSKLPLFDNKHNILMFFIISSISVYIILSIGWSANSKYSYLGAIRSVAQMISYEVSFFLIILFSIILSNSYALTQMKETQAYLWLIWGNLTLFIMWITCCLAEVNRSPFDFAEGESELVSGFNVEYMGGWFALIFLAEYTNMIILMVLSTMIFFKDLSSLASMFMLIILAVSLLWFRGTYPRFRYDILMNLNWMYFLPTILFMIPMAMFFNFTSI